MPRVSSTVDVASPYAEVRPLYERADGLLELIPAWLGGEIRAIEGPLEPLAVGSRFDVAVRPFGVGPRLGGTVEIVDRQFDDDGGYIEDVTVDGPFEAWRHRRTLSATSTGTRIVDDIRYRGPPAGRVGALAVPLVLEAVLAYRRHRLHRLFDRGAA